MLQALERRPFIDAHEIRRDAGLAEAGVRDALEALNARGAVVGVEADGATLYGAPSSVESLIDAMSRHLRAYHDTHPLRGGMPLEELRSKLRLDARQLSGLLMLTNDVRVESGVASLVAFEPAPTPDQLAKIDGFLDALRSSPGHPPPSGDVSAELLAYLVQRGEVVDVGEGIIFDAAAYGSMRQRVVGLIERQGAITLAQARDLLGTSRKHAQALLEHLDRERVTRRVGDERVLR